MTRDNYRRGRHSVTELYTHLVFVTKYRRKLFQGKHIEAMLEICQGVARQMNFKIVEMNGEDNHIHLLIEYPPKLSISQIVNSLKGVSSRMLRKEFEELRNQKHLWSPSYFAISCESSADSAVSVEKQLANPKGGGAPIEKIRKYIENQEKPS